jgi:ketosteroid isomerase-like protein
MSEQALAAVRELTEALNAEDVERQVRVLDPEVVQHGTRGGMDQDRTVRGRDAVLAYWDEIGDAWERLRFEPEKLIEVGDDVVVGLWHEFARSRHSDLELRSETATVFKLRGGRIVEMTGYLSWEGALEAAGATD